MRREWPQGATDFAATVAAVVKELNGVEAARRAEAKPDGHRSQVIGPRLDVLGTLSLDPCGDEEEAAAAALAVREAGRAVLPWPLVHVLSVPAAVRGEYGALHLTSGTPAALDHADLTARPVAVDVRDGQVYEVTVVRRRPGPLDPFGCEVRAGRKADGSLGPSLAQARWTHLLLDAFWVSGALAEATGQALRHARDRHQFGVPIGRFGEIRWRVADMILARDSLDELALYTWWLRRSGRASPADLLALRVQTLESAHSVLAHAHQILAATGLCEEHDLAVIDRHLQPVLRRPLGRLATTALLAERVRLDGFDALFPVPARPGPGPGPGPS